MLCGSNTSAEAQKIQLTPLMATESGKSTFHSEELEKWIQLEIEIRYLQGAEIQEIPRSYKHRFEKNKPNYEFRTHKFPRLGW